LEEGGEMMLTAGLETGMLVTTAPALVLVVNTPPLATGTLVGSAQVTQDEVEVTVTGTIAVHGQLVIVRVVASVTVKVSGP